MDNQVLGIIILILTGILVIFIGIGVYIAKNSQTPKSEIAHLKTLIPRRKHRRYSKFLDRVHEVFFLTPGIKVILRKVKSRLAILYIDEDHLVKRNATMYTFISLVVFVALLAISLVLGKSLYSKVAIIATSAFAVNVVIDMFVKKVETDFMISQLDLMSNLRHEYHQTKRVTESLDRVSVESKGVASPHFRKIFECLTSLDPEEELLKYYEVCPNIHIKKLAGISRQVDELGDLEDEPSIYLEGLSKISEELQMDIMKRERLRYSLSGTVFVALVTVFFTEPLRVWAETNFEIMKTFYSSKLGTYALVTVYLSVLVSYVSLQILRSVDDDTHSAQSEGAILSRLLKYRRINILISRLAPTSGETLRSALIQNKTLNLLRSVNSSLSVKEFYLKRVLYAVAIFFIVILIQISSLTSVKNMLMGPEIDYSTPALSSVEIRERERLEFERRYMEEVISSNLHDSELTAYIEEATAGKYFLPSTMTRDEYFTYLVERVKAYRQEVYKWTHLLIAFCIGLVGYWIPLILVYAKRWVRLWEMQNEVASFYTLIGVLYRLDRIRVYDILEWLHRHSSIFKHNLSKCLANYESGPEEALLQCKEESGFVPFGRLMDRLRIAANAIPVREAFEDLDQERSFSLEQRALQTERMIDRRSSYGSMIALFPSGCLLLVYLLLPFLFMAFSMLEDTRTMMGGL